MRILIVGCGAIGGVTAAYLTWAGGDVQVLCHDPAQARRLTEPGLRLVGLRGEMLTPLSVASAPSQLSGVFDAILLITKAYDMPDAARSVLPYLAANGLMVSVQNGMCWQELAEIVGIERTAACVVSFSSTQLSQDEVEFTGEGGYLLGLPGRPADSRVRQLAETLSLVAPAQASDQILGAIYSKLIINSGITAGGALTGLTLGQLLLRTSARRMFIALVREDMALAAAQGVSVPPFGGRLDYQRFLAGNGILARVRRHLTLLAVGFRYWRLTSSSLTSLRRGKPTEIAYLNGWIASQSQAVQLSAPVNQALFDLVRQIELGQRAISPDNLHDLPLSQPGKSQ